jgi:hypothetical protein
MENIVKREAKMSLDKRTRLLTVNRISEQNWNDMSKTQRVKSIIVWMANLIENNDDMKLLDNNKWHEWFNDDEKSDKEKVIFIDQGYERNHKRLHELLVLNLEKMHLKVYMNKLVEIYDEFSDPDQFRAFCKNIGWRYDVGLQKMNRYCQFSESSDEDDDYSDSDGVLNKDPMVGKYLKSMVKRGDKEDDLCSDCSEEDEEETVQILTKKVAKERYDKLMRYDFKEKDWIGLEEKGLMIGRVAWKCWMNEQYEFDEDVDIVHKLHKGTLKVIKNFESRLLDGINYGEDDLKIEYEMKIEMMIICLHKDVNMVK